MRSNNHFKHRSDCDGDDDKYNAIQGNRQCIYKVLIDTESNHSNRNDVSIIKSPSCNDLFNDDPSIYHHNIIHSTNAIDTRRSSITNDHVIFKDLIRSCQLRIEQFCSINTPLKQQTSSLVIRSMILLSSEGGGKTYVMNQLATMCRERSYVSAHTTSSADDNNNEDHYNDDSGKSDGRFSVQMWVYQSSCDDVLSNQELRVLSEKYKLHSDAADDDFDDVVDYHLSLIDTSDDLGRIHSIQQMRMLKQVFHYFRNCLVLLKKIDSVSLSFHEFIYPSHSYLLFIDDMDNLFSSLTSASENNYSDASHRNKMIFTNSSNYDSLKMLTYNLHKLLELLNCSTDLQGVNLFICGASRLKPSQLPRSHVGAPEFDIAVVIPSLSLEERYILALLALSSIDDIHPLQSIIESNATNKTKVGNNNTTSITIASTAAATSYVVDAATEEKNGNDDDDDDRFQRPHQHQSHRERNMHAWASGIANLSMGYAPGDIIAVIHRMVLIHTGKKSISVPSTSSSSTSSSLSSSSLSSFSISWKSLLEAITIVRPKAVASLSSMYSHDSMSSMFDASHQLTWSDFIGYHDIVNDLKRRLHYFQSSPLAPTTASTNPLPVIQSQSKSQSRSGFGINEMGFKGMVIAGPSGCGKSLLAKVLASEVRHHNYHHHYHHYHHHHHHFYYHSHHYCHYNHHYIIVLTFHYPHIL